MHSANITYDELWVELQNLKKENESLKKQLLYDAEFNKNKENVFFDDDNYLKLLEDDNVLEAIVNAIPDGLAISNLDGVVKFASQNIIELLGYDNVNEILGKNILEFVRTDYHDKALHLIGELLNGNPTGATEYVMLHKNGSELVVESNADILRNSSGEPFGMLIINRDVTQRKQSEQKLSQIMELFTTGPNVVFKWKSLPNWPVEYVSQNVFTQFGYKPEDFIEGTINYMSIIHPEDIDRVALEVTHYTNMGVSSFEQEYRIYNSSGQARWIFDHTVIYRDESTGIKHFQGTIIDITDKQLSRMALNDIQAVHIKMIANISDVIVIIDQNGINRYKSPNIEKLFGWKPEEVVGESTWNNVHPDDLEASQKFIISLAAAPNNKGTTQLRYLKKDGSYCWIEITILNLLHDPDVSGFLGNYHDISERKLAEDTLLQSEEKYRMIAESTSDALLVFENNALIYASPAFANILGFNFGENGILDSDQIAKMLHPDDVEKTFRNIFKAMREKQKSLMYQYRAKHKDGYYVWLEDTASFVYNEKGENYRTYVISRDITHRINSENELRKLYKAIEQSPVSVIITDVDGNIEYANAKTSVTTGYSQNELLGQNPRILKSGEQINEFYEKLWDTISTGNIWKGELHNRRKNGELYWESTTIAPLSEINGTITNYIGIKEDITARKQIEGKLKSSEAKLQAILDNLQDAYFQADLDGNLIYVNPTALRMYGYDDEMELLGHSASILYADIENRHNLISKLKSKGEAKDFVIFARRKDNSAFWVSMNVQYIKDINGQIIGTEGVIRDISSRIKLQHELIASKERAEQSEYKVRSMFDNSLVGFMYFTLDGCVKDANAAALAILGSPSLEATRQINALTYLPLIESGFSGNIRRCILENNVVNGETLYKSHWGKISYLKYYIIPMVSDGEVVGVWSNINDLTDLWKVQQDLLQAKEKAEESDRLKSAFLQNISHEIRTPINGIIGFSKMLSEFDLSVEERTEYGEVLVISCNRLMNTVNDIIDISQIDTMAVQISKSVLMPLDIIQNLYETYQGRIYSNGVDLVVNNDPISEYLSIKSDSRSISQIINSFLSNAEKFTTKGKIEIGFSIKNETITFCVKDTGIGIPRSEIDRIFERFYQVDLSISRGYEGSGLGLSIAKGLSDLLGGKIWVESEVNIGSNFYFSLPIN